MTNKPFFSIITNFYNTEDYISEAIESVISQTYPNWELILINDGSSDNSTSIAKAYVISFPGKIIYLEHENHKNKGTSASRNLGVKHARGNFITFLDSDDVYLPNRLEEHSNIFTNDTSIEAIFGATKYWYSWNASNFKSEDYVQTLEISTGIYYPPELLILMLTKKAAVPCMGGLTVKKNIFDSVGGFEEEFTGMYDDQVLYSKLMLNSKIFVDENFYDLYRQHNTSTCYHAIKSNSVHNYEYIFLSWLNRYVSNNFSNYSKLLRITKRLLSLCSFPRIYNIYNKFNRKKEKIIRAIP